MTEPNVIPQANDGNGAANRVVAKQQAIKKAAEMVAAMHKPPEAEAPAPPPEPAAPAPAPTGTAAGTAPEATPAPAAPEPKAEPEPKPAEEAKAPEGEPQGAPDRSWQALHSAEKRLAEEKKQLDEAKKQLENAPSIQGDPIDALLKAGWSEDQVASLLVTRAEKGLWKPTAAEAAGHAPQQQTHQPAPVAPPAKSDEENKALLERIGNLEGHIIKQEWKNASLQDPSLKFISSMPEGVDFALERAYLHLNTTGQALTPAEGLAMAQSELIEREKQRLETLRSNPAAAEALGLTGSPAPAAPEVKPEAKAEDEPPLTTISNDVAASPSQPPVLASEMSEKQRHQRAVDAIKRAYSGQ